MAKPPRKVGASTGPKGVGNRGKGRVKGTPNKVTRALKEMILGALDDAGGQEYLAKQAKESPAAFLTLIGKVLPTEVKADVNAQHSGPGGGPMRFESMSDSELDARIAQLNAAIARQG